MKKIGIIIFLVALLIGVVFANFFSFGKVQGGLINFSFKRGIKGSGNVVSEQRDVRDFKAIEVKGVFNVEIVAQKDFSALVEADDNLLPVIRTEVRNGVLEIFSEKRIHTHGPVTVRLSAPDIQRIEASGATKVSLADLKNSGITLDTSGASKIDLSGETSMLNVDVSGASKVDAERLMAANAVIDSSGASKVMVNVTGNLRIDSSGASSVVYSGTPANVEKKTSGASKVVTK